MHARNHDAAASASGTTRPQPASEQGCLTPQPDVAPRVDRGWAVDMHMGELPLPVPRRGQISSSDKPVARTGRRCTS